MPYITTQQSSKQTVDLYYEVHGSGPPVLLMHTWPLNGDSWEKQRHALLAAGYQVIQMDRRGFGKSDRPSDGYDLETLTKDLKRLIEYLDLQDAVLIGHSLGAIEIAHYLGKYGSSRVRKAVFVATVGPYLVKAGDNLQGVDRSVFDGIQAALLSDRPAMLASALFGIFGADILPKELISQVKLDADQMTATQASAIAVHDTVNVWLADVRADHDKIDIPTLVIHGTADKSAPIEITGMRISKHRQAEFVAVKGAPHGLIWTHAQEVNNAVLEFIK